MIENDLDNLFVLETEVKARLKTVILIHMEVSVVIPFSFGDTIKNTFGLVSHNVC